MNVLNFFLHLKYSGLFKPPSIDNARWNGMIKFAMKRIELGEPIMWAEFYRDGEEARGEIR